MNHTTTPFKLPAPLPPLPFPVPSSPTFLPQLYTGPQFALRGSCISFPALLLLYTFLFPTLSCDTYTFLFPTFPYISCNTILHMLFPFLCHHLFYTVHFYSFTPLQLCPTASNTLTVGTQLCLNDTRPTTSSMWPMAPRNLRPRLITATSSSTPNPTGDNPHMCLVSALNCTSH